MPFPFQKLVPQFEELKSPPLSTENLNPNYLWQKQTSLQIGGDSSAPEVSTRSGWILALTSCPWISLT